MVDHRERHPCSLCGRIIAVHKGMFASFYRHLNTLGRPCVGCEECALPAGHVGPCFDGEIDRYYGEDVSG